MSKSEYYYSPVGYKHFTKLKCGVVDFTTDYFSLRVVGNRGFTIKNGTVKLRYLKDELIGFEFKAKRLQEWQG